MTFRFTFEAVVGTIYLTLTLFLGQMAVWVFLFFTPIFFLPRMRRQNMDEREIQLFYKIGNWSTVSLFLSYLLIENLADVLVYGHKLGDYRIQLCVSLFLLTRGLTGLTILSKN